MIKLVVVSSLIFLLKSTKLLLRRAKSDQFNCTAYQGNTNNIIAVQNCEDNNQYITTIGIGTPPQNFTILIDSGSNILWIPATGCTGTCGKIFNLNQSSTVDFGNETISIQYGDGSGVSGTYGSDITQFYGTNINVNTGVLWVTIDNPGNLITDGLIGLGFNDTDNIFDSAYKAGQISTNAFMLKLESNVFDSQLYFDTFPEDIVNSTVFVPQYQTGHWQVNTIGFLAGDIDMTSSASSMTLIDSGTSIFYFNNLLYQVIVEAYFSQCTIQSGLLYCSCNINFPTFTFYFETVQTFIFPDNYTIVEGNTCIALFSSINEDFILLGDTFLRNYAITFKKDLNKLSNSQIGFAGNMGIVYVIGGTTTQFFYIGQMVGTGMAGVSLVFSVVLWFGLNSAQKISQPLLN